MNFSTIKWRGWLVVFLVATSVRADYWSSWGQISSTTGAGARLASDGTNMYYSTYLDGVYRATLADGNFSLMPMTGFPLWDANNNTNGFAVGNVATTPRGTIVISGSQVSVTFGAGNSNTITFNPPGSSANTLPVFYWWDETNQLWHAATVVNKSYPYTGNVGNFSVAPDGSLWTCSGFYPYAYRSTNEGHTYTAFDINARVPVSYLPMPNGQTTFGEVFSIQACWDNRIVIGTETGGFLQSTNTGTSWVSLDPAFPSTNTVSPLGHIGDARIAGLDHYGNVLLNNYQLALYPGFTNWTGIQLIGWRPADGAYFPATNGFLASLGSGHIFTPPSGVSFIYMNQNSHLQGGIYRSPDGKNWSQFNTGSGLDTPFALALTNLLGAGGCITAVGNVVYIGVGKSICMYDSTPPPIYNRPPVAFTQNLNLWENTSTNLTLTGSDADGNALNFTILTPPHGELTGTPPDLTYTPSNNFVGLDGFSFVVDDGTATSAPAFVNFYINAPTNTLSTVALTSPADGQVFIAPTNLAIVAAASDPDGITVVNFYSGSLNNRIGTSSVAPYTIIFTNLPPGDYTFSARAFDGHGARTWSAPVRVSVLAVKPHLSIQPAGPDNVAVTWPLALDGFYIESAPDAAGPWTLSPYPPLFFTNGQTATIPIADQQFFRLMRP